MGEKKGLQSLPNGTVRDYINIGWEMETDDTLPLAKSALVLLVVCFMNRRK